MHFSFLSLLVVGAGGFAGATSRYLLSVTVDDYFNPDKFPVGIALTNVIGCLLIGFLSGYFMHKGVMNAELRLFVFTGFLGGFTTFSTFINDTFMLGSDRAISTAMLNAGGQVIVGLLAVWLGYSLVKLVF